MEKQAVFFFFFFLLVCPYCWCFIVWPCRGLRSRDEQSKKNRRRAAKARNSIGLQHWNRANNNIYRISDRHVFPVKKWMDSAGYVKSSTLHLLCSSCDLVSHSLQDVIDSLSRNLAISPNKLATLTAELSQVSPTWLYLHISSPLTKSYLLTVLAARSCLSGSL